MTDDKGRDRPEHTPDDDELVEPTDDTDLDRPTRPAPGIEHQPEPDAENIIPVKDGPGTL
jgi:hypothetical protein